MTAAPPDPRLDDLQRRLADLIEEYERDSGQRVASVTLARMSHGRSSKLFTEVRLMKLRDGERTN